MIPTVDLEHKFKAQTIIDEGRTSREAIDEIKDWLAETKLPHIPEELIVLFLLSCQNVIKDTQRTIKAYFKIKHSAPEMFSDRDVESEELTKASRVISCISIPRRMNNNTVIHFFKINDTNYQNFNWLLCMKLAFMLMDISQRTNPPSELVVVIDMKGVSTGFYGAYHAVWDIGLKSTGFYEENPHRNIFLWVSMLGFMHLTRFKIGAAKVFLEFLQEAMPLKIKMIHIINSNYVFDRLLSIARVFIKSDLMAILKSHPAETDMLQFQKDHIPANYLPQEYGGELPSSDELNENCIQQFKELKEFFKAEEELISCYK